MLVFFDDVWNPKPQLGKQPEPIPNVHNSGWVQSPGAKLLRDTLAYGKLESYVAQTQGIGNSGNWARHIYISKA